MFGLATFISLAGHAFESHGNGFGWLLVAAVLTVLAGWSLSKMPDQDNEKPRKRFNKMNIAGLRLVR